MNNGNKYLEGPLRAPDEPTYEVEDDNDRRFAAIDEDGGAAEGDHDVDDTEVLLKEHEKEQVREEKVTWASLPHRRQLIILTLARLSEPLVQTSLQVRFYCCHSRLDTY